jgi:DNA-binding NtrC family response regulator
MSPSNEDNRPVALVVDDEGGTREFLRQALETYGFSTFAAENGEEGWQLFQRKAPTLVVSDIYMPKTNGVVLLTRIKDVAPRLPVILITGYSHYRQLLESAKFPPDGFLAKPISVESLFDEITRVIRRVTGE